MRCDYPYYAESRTASSLFRKASVDYMPEISVLIPVYNVEKYLDRCIQSVVGQTFSDIEIILVDDGSTDGSSDICDSWAKKDSRVKVIRKEYGGVSTARNVCISAAKGKYLYFVDSDDEIVPDALEILHDLVIANDCDMAFARFIKIYSPDDDPSAYEPPFTGETMSFDEDSFWTYLYKVHCDDRLHEIAVNMIVPVNKLTKADAYAGLKYVEGKIHEDEHMIHELISHCKKTVFTDQRLYNYYQNPKSIMYTRNYGDNASVLEALSVRTEYFAKNKKDYTLNAFLDFNWRFLRDYQFFDDDRALKKHLVTVYRKAYRAAKPFLKEGTSKVDRLYFSALSLGYGAYKALNKLLTK